MTTKPKAKSASTAARATARTSAATAKKRAPAKAAAAKTPTVKATSAETAHPTAAKAAQTASAEAQKAGKTAIAEAEKVVSEAPKAAPVPEVAPEPAKFVAETKAAVAETAKKVERAVADAEPLVESSSYAIVQGLEQAMLIAKQQAEKASEMASKSLEDVSLANKSTYDSWVKSGETFSKGFEEISNSLLAYAQNSAEANMSATKDMMGCTNVNDLWALQSSHAKACFDGMLAEGTKINEMMAATLNDAFGQIGTQFKAQLEQAWKPLKF